MLDLDELLTSENYRLVMQDLTPELKTIFTDILEDLCDDGFDPEIDLDKDIMDIIDWYFDNSEKPLPISKSSMLENVKYVIEQ